MQSARSPQSNQSPPIHLGPERRSESRREHPTRPWNRLFGGPLRRAKGRRLTDRSHYVDIYSRKDAALLLAILLLNVGDAFFTMLWLGRGGREANPIMDFFLDIGTGAFIAQKCFVVGLWLVILIVHKNFRFARMGLYAAFCVYATLILVHFAIIVFDVQPHPPIAEVDAKEIRRRILMENAPERLDFSTLIDAE